MLINDCNVGEKRLVEDFMFLEIFIKNFVIIEEILFNFEIGMIVLIGEIGVGKFIIIDVMNMMLGFCVSVEVICYGVNKVEIEGFFFVEKN